MGLLEETTLALEEGTILSSRVSRHSQENSSIHGSKKEKGYTYTERFLSSLMAFISIFLRPILYLFWNC